MKRTKITLSSTHIDSHGMMMTKSALESGLEFINGNRKVRMGLEHDMTLPPLGRINDAQVIRGVDDEYYLTAYQEFFDKRELVTLETGETLISESFNEGGTPFTEAKEYEPKGIEISVDPVNFEKLEHSRAFYNRLKQTTELEISNIDIIRKAQILDPEIVFKFTENIVYALFGYKIAKLIIKKTIKKLGNKISDDLSKIYDLIKNAILLYAKKAIPKNRPITYIFVFPAKIQIELIAISDSPNTIIESLYKSNLKQIEYRIIELVDLFNPEKIQFILNDQNKWEFNYLLTHGGATIGTEKSFDRRDKSFELLVEKCKEIQKSNKKK